jgi:hypothetical protein
MMHDTNRITLNKSQFACIGHIINGRPITGIEYIFDRLDPSMPHIVAFGLEGVPMYPGHVLGELWHVYESGAAPLKMAELYEMPYSEVCCHMKIAGTQQWLRSPHPHNGLLCQIVTLNEQGKLVNFSGPITDGEAGMFNARDLMS